MTAFVRLFARHPTAANLLMVMAIVGGIVAITRLNTQFFPTLGFDIIQVTVDWPGASAEDVESGIIEVVEPEVRFLDGVQTVTSTAREGIGSVSIEFADGTDIQNALSNVEQAVDRLTTLPLDSEDPTIQRIELYENVTRVAVSGNVPEPRLKEIAERIRDDLLERGIDRVVLFGARDEEIRVEVDEATLRRLDLTLGDIAGGIAEMSQDTPLGRLEGAVERQLRALGLRETAADIAMIEIRSFETGARIVLGDVALVSEDFDRSQAVGRLDDNTAIELVIQRSATADALQSAAAVDRYLADQAGSWPSDIAVTQFDPFASLISDRIRLLVENGATGLVLVLLILFIFLNARVAFWIAAGIPISLLATAGVMLALGQSINMLSLFGAIMSLGIIVDDAIVVGEHAALKRSQGLSAARAAETGALRMLAPVTAASLTTIATFLPILLIGNMIGQVVTAIPQVVVAVLIASLIECFLILPAHMKGALKRDPAEASRFRHWFDRKFQAFRDGPFRRAASVAVRWRYATVATAISLMMLSFGMIMNGHLPFVFFQSPESDTIYADVAFAPGTPRTESEAMVAELARALRVAEDGLTGGGDTVVEIAFGRVAASEGPGGAASGGDHNGSLFVQLLPSDSRTVRNGDLIAAWRNEIVESSGLERLEIRERTGGPPGRDIDIRLSGGGVTTLKDAALEVQDLLRGFAGVSNILDNQPYGRPEILIELTPRGRALGFTTESGRAPVAPCVRGGDRRPLCPRR